MALGVQLHVGLEPAHAGIRGADEALEGGAHVLLDHQHPHVLPYLQPPQDPRRQSVHLPALRQLPGEGQKGGPLEGKLGGQGPGQGFHGGEKGPFLGPDHGHLAPAALLPLLTGGVLVQQEHEPVGQRLPSLHAQIQHVAVFIQGQPLQAAAQGEQQQQERAEKQSLHPFPPFPHESRSIPAIGTRNSSHPP